jgi:hypothetical protein
MCTHVEYIIPHEFLSKTRVRLVLNVCNECKADVEPHARINLHWPRKWEEQRFPLTYCGVTGMSVMLVTVQGSTKRPEKKFMTCKTFSPEQWLVIKSLI